MAQQSDSDKTPAVNRPTEHYAPPPAAERAASADASSETEPTQIGRYRVVHFVARGGMGKVYKGHDPVLNRDVALKLPRLEGTGTDGSWKSRFIREAQAAARIRHAGVCPIYDVGEHEGMPFVVMAYVEGVSLARRLDTDNPYQEPRQAAALTLQIAEALAAVHQHGIIHRDLKPGNILLDRSGNAILTDFGLARPLNEEERLTLPGQAVGTPGYMAPEQAAGHYDRIGPWSDIYSLGTVLQRLLTGELAGHIADADLDPDLKAIVLKATAQRPEDRFASASAFAGALADWLARAPADTDRLQQPTRIYEREPASSKTPFLTLVKPGRARRRLFISAAILVFGLLLLLPVARLIDWNTLLEQPPIDPVKPNGDKRPPRRGPLLIAAEPRRFPVGGALSRRALVTRPAAIPGLESWTVETRQPRGPIRAVAHRPDGAILAAAGDDGMIRLWDADGQRLRRILVGHDGALQCLAWSGDGRYLASADDTGMIALWEPEAGKLLRILPGQGGRIRALAWNPHGAPLVSVADDRKVRFWNPESGVPWAEQLEFDKPITTLAWSTAGDVLALAGNYPEIFLWRLASHTFLPALAKHAMPMVHALAWSRQGALASAAQDGLIGLWQPPQDRRDMPAAGMPVLALAWSPDGKKLAAGTAAGIQIRDRRGKLLHTLADHPDIVSGLSWSVDGSELAAGFQGGSICIWSGQKLSHTIAAHPAGRPGLGWSPNGKLLAVAGHTDQQLRLWQADKGEFFALPAPINLTAVHAWFPDNKSLARIGPNRSIELYDIVADRVAGTFAGHAADLTALLASRDRKRLVSAARDGSVCVWQMNQAAPAARLGGIPGTIFSLAADQRAERIAVGTVGTVHVWTTAEAKARLLFDKHEGAVHALAWSPDGKWIAAGESIKAGQLHWLDAVTGKPRQPPWQPHDSGVSSLGWSSDGKVLATSSMSGDIGLWDGNTGKPLAMLRGHGGAAGSLTWHPQLEVLACAGQDGAVRLVAPARAGAGAVLAPLQEIHGLAVSADGHFSTDAPAEDCLVYVLQSASGQEVLAPAAFAAGQAWKNDPARTRLPAWAK